jgi:hypothetical protein
MNASLVVSLHESQDTGRRLGSLHDPRPVIRLRFVQEYRGRRIVTNGKLFGVEGELITDCRYLNVTGAREAISSEDGVAIHRQRLAGYRDRLIRLVRSELRGRSFGCKCRDQNGAMGRQEMGVAILWCAACRSYRLIMPASKAPAVTNTQKDNKAGKKGPGLTKLAQLPPLEDDALRFIWDIDQRRGSYIIKAGDRLVWRERAGVEDWTRFYEVEFLLKRKYHNRFVSLTPTIAAAANLLGRDALAALTST